jgi:hypothetical protein
VRRGVEKRCRDDGANSRAILCNKRRTRWRNYTGTFPALCRNSVTATTFAATLGYRMLTKPRWKGAPQGVNWSQRNNNCADAKAHTKKHSGGNKMYDFLEYDSANSPESRAMRFISDTLSQSDIAFDDESLDLSGSDDETE